MTKTTDTSDAPAEIVQDDQLGGEPRLAGHRIDVFHIWTHSRRGKTAADIAARVYPHLRIEQVETALAYAREHPDRMATLERERERRARTHRREARERKQSVLGDPCPACDGRLVDGEALPLALVRCRSCGATHVVTLLDGD
jgi:uncharacterized protein (DUF433 family)